MISAERKRERLSVDERRARLIEVGKQVFSERPYDEVSTGEIAKLAGVSAGLPYHYFKNKRGFYVETVRAVSNEITDAMVLEEDIDVTEAVGMALETFVDFVSENLPLYRSVILGGVGADEDVRAIADRVRSVTILRVLERVDVGELPAALRMRLRGWLGFVESAVLHWVENQDVPRTELLRALTETLEQQLPLGMLHA